MSWLPDVLVYRSSILPTIMGSVSVVTLFAAAVAAVSIWWGKEVGLTNNVGAQGGPEVVLMELMSVPLLSIVVGLLLGECAGILACEHRDNC